MIRAIGRQARHAPAATMLLFVGLWPTCPAAMGQESEDPRQQRLQFLQARVAEFQLSVQAAPDKPLPLTESPVLRFSNPVRDSSSDGAIFLWLAGTRPLAVASLWIRNSGEAGFDLASFSAEPLRCAREGKVPWSPRTGLLIDRPLEDAPQAAPTPPQRLAQMRQLAGRFSAEIGAWPQEGFRKLRLMPRPIYRYAAHDAGVLDGAIFALTLANDPEVLIRLEAARPQGDGDPAWSYSLARMSALRMKVRLDNMEIFETGGYWLQPRSPTDPYMEATFADKFSSDPSPGDQ